MITEYHIIDTWDTDETEAYRLLIYRVNILIKEGWQPQGGISVAFRPPMKGAEGHWVVTQAMVKHD